MHQPQQGSSFESYVEKGPAPTQPGASGPTPMELARPPSRPEGPPTMDSLHTQAQSAQDTLGNIHKQLQTPNLHLQRSQTHLLRNKLTDANDYAKAASKMLGVETPPMKTPQESGSIARFLAYINDGQDQFAAIQTKLKEMSASGQQINSGDMLLLQSKMALAQQEIEYSATLLSRVVSSITTIMGIQL